MLCCILDFNALKSKCALKVFAIMANSQATPVQLGQLTCVRASSTSGVQTLQMYWDRPKKIAVCLAVRLKGQIMHCAGTVRRPFQEGLILNVLGREKSGSTV